MKTFIKAIKSATSKEQLQHITKDALGTASITMKLKKLAETLGGIISYCASSLIFAILIYFTYKLKSTGIINMDIMMLLFIINAIIYVVLIFAFMNLSFKITDKINKKYDNTKK